MIKNTDNELLLIVNELTIKTKVILELVNEQFTALEKIAYTLSTNSTINKNLIPRNTVFEVEGRPLCLESYNPTIDKFRFYEFGNEMSNNGKILEKHASHIVENAMVFIENDSYPSSPISNGINLQIYTRNGAVERVNDAENLQWDHTGEGDDIIAYKILETLI